MRRLLLIPVLAAVVIPAAAAKPARPPGDQRVAVGGRVSVVLPAGWHLTHGKGTPLIDPIPRLSAATFAVHFSRQHCVCGTPRVANFPRDGAYLFVMEYPVLGRREAKTFPAHTTRFRIARSAITPGDCGPSDGRLFREGGRGYQVQIYLGPAAPASARAQIAAILDSWQVTPASRYWSRSARSAAPRRRLESRVGPAAVGGVDVHARRDDLVDAIEHIV